MAVEHVVARRRISVLLVALCALLVLAGGRPSRAGEEPKLRQEHAKLARKALKDLLTVWKASEGKQAEAFAIEVAWQVVHFDENHAAARAMLGHTKNAAGEWAEVSRHKIGWDENPSAVPPLRQQRETLLKPTITALGKLLDKVGSKADSEQRAFLLDDLAALAPQDPRVVAEWKETRLGTRWISVETWRGHKLWDDWTHALVRLAKANTDGAESPPPARFQGIPGIVWNATWKAKEIPVWTTGHPNEARYVSNVLTTGTELMRHILGEPAPLPEGLGVVVLVEKAERARFAAGLNLSELDRRQIGEGAAYALPRTEILVTARTQGFKVRTDSALRLLYVRFYRELYGLGAHSVWAEQAFSLTLTHAAHGTRLTVMGGQPPADMGELEARLVHDLFQEGALWMAPARDLANQGLLPTALELAPQRRSAIYVLDLLSCCAHGAYLLRARPAEAPKLFRALGQGKTLTEALDAVFGLTPEAFHEHLIRFLNDVSPDEGEKTLSRRIVGTPPR